MHRTSQRCIPRLACGIFGALPSPMPSLHTQNMQGYMQRGAALLAVRSKGIGRILQTMVDMDGLHLPRPGTRSGVQQGAGIGATAIGQRYRQGRLRRLQGRQQ